MTFTLLGMAAKLAAVAIETEAAIQLVVEDAAGLVQETAKNAMGTYEFGWPQLQPETVARKATGDSPLLETGELRDSIEKTIGHRLEQRQGRLARVRHVNDTAKEIHSLGWNDV